MRRLININDVAPLLNKGCNYEQIAEILNFPKNSIGRFCRKHFGKLADRYKTYRQKITITPEQEEVIFGSLLGDMCLTLPKNTYNIMGNECHSIKQVSYIEYKNFLLCNLTTGVKDVFTRLKDRIYQKKVFHIKANTNLIPFYQMFYQDFGGHKDVPYNLTLLTPRAIAFWFMDDGFGLTNGHGGSIGFSTCSFSIEGIQRLQCKLLEYGVETILRPKTHYLIVRRKSAAVLYHLIKSYLIPDMLYKFRFINQD